jgi:hypothetical protein
MHHARNQLQLQMRTIIIRKNHREFVMARLFDLSLLLRVAAHSPVEMMQAILILSVEASC